MSAHLLRATPTTRNPARPSTSHTPQPMPDEAPVTTATLPLHASRPAAMLPVAAATDGPAAACCNCAAELLVPGRSTGPPSTFRGSSTPAACPSGAPLGDRWSCGRGVVLMALTAGSAAAARPAAAAAAALDVDVPAPLPSRAAAACASSSSSSKRTSSGTWPGSAGKPRMARCRHRQIYMLDGQRRGSIGWVHLPHNLRSAYHGDYSCARAVKHTCKLKE
jgi:hypothetical protein